MEQSSLDKVMLLSSAERNRANRFCWFNKLLRTAVYAFNGADVDRARELSLQKSPLATQKIQLFIGCKSVQSTGLCCKTINTENEIIYLFLHI